MVKLIDVAKKANVSEATASLVMNNRPGVNTETRKKVLEVAMQLGYLPNFIARGLAMQKTHTIGLVVTDVENPFFGSLTNYIDESVLANGYNLILSVSNDDLELEDKIIYSFIGKRVDGVIVVPTVMYRDKFDSFDQLEKHNIPFVFSTSFYPEVDCGYVMSDLEQGTYMLTNYLVDLGHHDILFLVTSDRNVVPAEHRINGYKRALQEHDIDFDEKKIVPCSKPDFYCGYQTVEAIVRNHVPDAIITINDIMALGAKRAVKSLGFRVPEDISVAGYDNVIFSSISETPLTSVHQDTGEISKKTVELLLRKIEGREIEEKYQKIKTELVIRKSTDKCSKSGSAVVSVN